MTRKERATYLNQLIIPDLLDNSQEACELRMKQETALRETIAELTQEPCTDCISRKEAMKIMDWGWKKGIYPSNKIAALPPVTPAEKVGQWIYNKNLSSYYGDVYICSECGCRCLESCYDHINKLPDFCPKCHTKMEVEE